MDRHTNSSASTATILAIRSKIALRFEIGGSSLRRRLAQRVTSLRRSYKHLDITDSHSRPLG
jgi:hypothetical protein